MSIYFRDHVHLADQEGPLGSSIPEFSTTMAKTVFRKLLEALVFSAISGP